MIFTGVPFAWLVDPLNKHSFPNKTLPHWTCFLVVKSIGIYNGILVMGDIMIPKIHKPISPRNGPIQHYLWLAPWYKQAVAYGSPGHHLICFIDSTIRSISHGAYKTAMGTPTTCHHPRGAANTKGCKEMIQLWLQDCINAQPKIRGPLFAGTLGGDTQVYILKNACNKLNLLMCKHNAV